MFKTIVMLSAAGLIFALAGASQASLIYSTIPSSNSYNSGYSYAIGGSGTSWGDIDVAARFAAPAISDLYLDSIEIACRSYSSSNISDITVMITADNAERPGTVLAAVQVTAPASSAIVTADFANNLQLTAGIAYWVRLSAAAASGQIFWHISQPVVHGTCDHSNNNGLSWEGYGNGELPAFRVNGVPEPTTICLLGLGALSLIRKKN